MTPDEEYHWNLERAAMAELMDLANEYEVLTVEQVDLALGLSTDSQGGGLPPD